MKFISFYKKHIRLEIEKVVSYMQDTTVPLTTDTSSVAEPRGRGGGGGGGSLFQKIGPEIRRKIQ